MLDTSNLLGFNTFAYCGNNPVNREDDSGEFWDVVFDIASIAYSAYQAIKNPSLSNFLGLAADIVCAVVPVATGGGAAVRAISKADDAYDAVKVATKADDVYDTVKVADKIGDTYSGARATTSFSGGVCFVAGTAVFTENGYKNIEDIKAGDKVWATNPETEETELKKVVQTFVNETNELVHIYVNNEEIVTTPEHPFYVSNYGWFGAIDLRAGDKLVLVNGEFAVVEKVQYEILEQPVKVHNFEVKDFHTYYVGDTGVLVHNNCRSPINTPDQNAVIQLAKENKNGLSLENAETLVEWAKEYDLPGNPRIDFGGHITGSNPITRGTHAHIGPVNHIPIID